MSDKPRKGLYGGYKPGFTGKKGSKDKKPKKSSGPSKEALQARNDRKKEEDRQRSIDNSVIGRDTDNASPLTLPVSLIAQGIKGVVGGMAGGIRNVSQAIKDVDKEEFKNMKFGEKLKTGLSVYGKGMKGFLGGTAQGLLGDDFGLVNDGEQELNEPQPTYTTNINTMGEEIPMKMSPIKKLAPYTASYSAYNMSAKEANKIPMMQKLSGASTLSPVNKFVDQTGDGEITQADVIEARTEGYKENTNKD